MPDVPQRCGYDHFIGQCAGCSGTFRNPEVPEPKAPTLEEISATVQRLRALDPCAKGHPIGLDGHCIRCGGHALRLGRERTY